MTASCSSSVMPSSAHGKVIMAISASSSDGNGAAVGSGTAVGAGGMAVGTGVGVDEGEIVGVVVEVLAVDDIVVGTGSSAGVEVKEGDSVPSTVVVAIGVGVGVGSVGVDVQAISANTKAGTARTCHPVRFKWSRRLAVAKSNSPILFLHSQRDIKDKHSILEHRGLHSHLGFPVCSHGLSRLRIGDAFRIWVQPGCAIAEQVFDRIFP